VPSCHLRHCSPGGPRRGLHAAGTVWAAAVISASSTSWPSPALPPRPGLDPPRAVRPTWMAPCYLRRVRGVVAESGAVRGWHADRVPVPRGACFRPTAACCQPPATKACSLFARPCWIGAVVGWYRTALPLFPTSWCSATYQPRGMLWCNPTYEWYHATYDLGVGCKAAWVTTASVCYGTGITRSVPCLPCHLRAGLACPASCHLGPEPAGPEHRMPVASHHCATRGHMLVLLGAYAWRCSRVHAACVGPRHLDESHVAERNMLVHVAILQPLAVSMCSRTARHADQRQPHLAAYHRPIDPSGPAQPEHRSGTMEY